MSGSIPDPEPSPSAESDDYTGAGRADEIKSSGPAEPTWRFSRHVDLVGGEEGVRMSRELAAAVRDLLEWWDSVYTGRADGGDGENDGRRTA